MPGDKRFELELFREEKSEEDLLDASHSLFTFRTMSENNNLSTVKVIRKEEINNLISVSENILETIGELKKDSDKAEANARKTISNFQSAFIAIDFDYLHSDDQRALSELLRSAVYSITLNFKGMRLLQDYTISLLSDLRRWIELSIKRHRAA